MRGRVVLLGEFLLDLVQDASTSGVGRVLHAADDGAAEQVCQRRTIVLGCRDNRRIVFGRRARRNGGGAHEELRQAVRFEEDLRRDLRRQHHVVIQVQKVLRESIDVVKLTLDRV